MPDQPRHSRARSERGPILRSMLSAAATMTGLITAYYLLPLREVGSGGALIRLVAGIVIVAAAVAWQIRSVAKATQPMLRAVVALALIVPLLVVMFAGTYVTISRSDPAAFNEPLDHTAALYFTVAALTTVGFGDIAPRSNLARIVVTVQMVVNVVLVGTSVKLIIDTARSHQPRRRPS